MAVTPGTSAQRNHDPEDDALDLADVEEVIDNKDESGDHAMDTDSDDEAAPDHVSIELHNDSIAYFDAHNSSIFSISSHPSNPSLLLTGGGDDVAHLWSLDPPSASDANITPRPCKHLKALTPKHTDSVIATAFTAGHAITAGLDGALHVFSAPDYNHVATAQEVEELVWLAPHPTEEVFAAGANDGTVWLYSAPLNLQNVFSHHGASCTAGAWSKDGRFLGTVSEDGSFYVWDVASGNTTPYIALTAADARFAVEGGLYSITFSPSGGVAAVGGATGEVRVVVLREGEQKGKIMAQLHAHSESVESLSFHPSVPLLASGSVDGKIALYDAGRGFAVRGTLTGHEEAVVKVEFVGMEWVLTSCGVDGTVRRWDARTNKELRVFRGHLGGNRAEGEGGVLGFVQNGKRIVTAGDDGVALVFEDEGASTTELPSMGVPR